MVAYHLKMLPSESPFSGCGASWQDDGCVATGAVTTSHDSVWARTDFYSSSTSARERAPRGSTFVVVVVWARWTRAATGLPPVEPEAVVEDHVTALDG